MNQNYNPRRLERYLILARQSGAAPVIVLTKADLTPAWAEFVARTEQLAPGVAVHAVSAATGFGLDGLARWLQPGKTIVFLGSSGVGKSSLVNALAGEELMAVGSIREGDGRGRHTTTHRQMLCLPSGVLIIDTPGMRALGMAEASEGLTASFADVEQYLGRCRFSDCSHTQEPGCAIRAAIERGELDPARWADYQQLQSESESHADAVHDREEMLRRKKEWRKNVALSRKARGAKK